MNDNSDFDAIRPYYLPEIKEAIQRIKNEPLFYKALAFLIPEFEKNEIDQRLDSVTSSYDFQKKIMHPIVWGIVDRSSGGLSESGFENLDPQKGYLFLSNHRDIFLDSAMLQILLDKNNLPTSEISFGSNLMKTQLLTDVGKINKMYTVFREGTARELYAHSQRLSAYIRHTTTEKNASLWLAHRGGRTKDGNDQTQVGLLKMLSASRKGTFQESFKELRMVPFVSSYEYEPCDIFKAKELLATQKGPYVKKPGEDLNSIVSGTVENKGRIHMAMGQMIGEEELAEIDNISNVNEKYNLLVKLIDKQIHLHFKLWPTNYLAVDMLEEGSRYAAQYTKEEKEEFELHLENRLKGVVEERKALRDILLEIYANPVRNFEKVSG